jgi:hypothetical protein
MSANTWQISAKSTSANTDREKWDMKRKAQPMLSADDQHALDQYTQVLQQIEDLSPITIRNYLSDLRQFIAWCEVSWHERQEDRFFAPQVVAPSLLVRYRQYLQTTLGLKPSTVNRTLTTMPYIRGTKQDLQQDVEKIAWI